MDYETLVFPDTMSDGSQCYVAEHPGLPGCVGYGPTPEDAKSSLARATEAYRRALQAAGSPAPKTNPTSMVIEWATSQDTPVMEPAAA